MINTDLYPELQLARSDDTGSIMSSEPEDDNISCSDITIPAAVTITQSENTILPLDLDMPTKSNICVSWWLEYISQIETANLQLLPGNYENVKTAYEHALDAVGLDNSAGLIWESFISFLRANSGDRVVEIREAFHRALGIPLDNLDSLFREYELWERELDPDAATNHLSTISLNLARARCSLSELASHLTAIAAHAEHLSGTIITTPTFSREERIQIGLWKTYIKWEESDPLRLEARTLDARVDYVYRKVLCNMKLYPQFWWQFYMRTMQCTEPEAGKAERILREGLEFNPLSFLLTFALAEHYETLKLHSDSDAVFRSLLDGLVVKFQIEPPDTEARAEYGLVWILYMRFAQRSQGINAFRVVLGRAKRDVYIPWTVYEAAAMMEHHHCQDSPDSLTALPYLTDNAQMAKSVFGSGMLRFGRNAEYVQKYLQFLIDVRDHAGAEALFETAIQSLSAEAAKPLWECYTEFVYLHASQLLTDKLQDRYRVAYPSDSVLQSFAKRYAYDTVDGIGQRDVARAELRPRLIAPKEVPHPRLPPLGEMSGFIASKEVLPAAARPKLPPLGPRNSKLALNRASALSIAAKEILPAAPRQILPPLEPKNRNNDRASSGWRRPKGSTATTCSPPSYRKMSVSVEAPSSRIPDIILRFIGILPAAHSFDGPLFCMDEYIALWSAASLPPV